VAEVDIVAAHSAESDTAVGREGCSGDILVYFAAVVDIGHSLLVVLLLPGMAQEMGWDGLAVDFE
jgi:hypothetical protein